MAFYDLMIVTDTKGRIFAVNTKDASGKGVPARAFLAAAWPTPSGFKAVNLWKIH